MSESPSLALPSPSIYTKSVSPARVPLDKLAKYGVRRSVQLPGVFFITSPGGVAGAAVCAVRCRGRGGGHGGTGLSSSSFW